MRHLLVLSFLCAAAPIHGQAPADDPPLDEIVVAGEFPGPGMWKVTRANDPAGHVLWIVGEPPPLPKRVKWKSTQVEAVALRAQSILREPSVIMETDKKVGMLKGLTLWPAMSKARKDPEGRKLKELLPADLYARWLVQKRLYLGRDSGVESWRPLFAAKKLSDAALEEHDLREGGRVWEVVGKLAKQHKITVNAPRLKFTVKTGGLRAKIKEFSRESLADVECFATTLAFTEALSDRDTEAARARAWATGDLETLSQLPPLPNPRLPCVMAAFGSQVAREVVPPDFLAQLDALWMTEAQKSIAAQPATLSIVPLGKIMREDGILAKLREQGYVIEAPQ